MPVVKLAMPMSCTSPSAPGIALGSVQGQINFVAGAGGVFTGLDDYGSVTIDALVQGATGGTLDIVFQSSIKPGRWFDVARLPQLANGAAPVRYVVTFNRARGGGTSTANVVNVLDGVPLITANTIYQFNLGDAVRLVLNAGAGTTQGAALLIDAAAYQI